MGDLRHVTCCFSGYRVEKMPFSPNNTEAVQSFCAQLEKAVICAAAAGYTRFFTGMSTGFDLWASEAVLRVKERLQIDLLCAIPYTRQANRFSPVWKRMYNHALLSAKQVFILSQQYHTGCFATRNQFMVDASSLLICYFDGQPGGTAQTVHMARKKGLDIQNLADAQLSPYTENLLQNNLFS